VVPPGGIGAEVPSGRTGVKCSAVVLPFPPGLGQTMKASRPATKQMPLPYMALGKLLSSGGSAGAAGGSGRLRLWRALHPVERRGHLARRTTLASQAGRVVLLSG
jgi:hypothetical protein